MLLLPPFVTHAEFMEMSRENLMQLAKNEDVVASLVVSVMKWRSLVDEVVASYDAALADFFSALPTPDAAASGPKGPLDEIAMWDAQVAALELSGQMKSDTTTLLLDMLQSSGDPEGLRELKHLEHSTALLHTRFAEASDAASHVAHIQPYAAHLQQVADGVLPLNDAVDTITPLFSTLRMVWNCSTAYGGGDTAGCARFWGLMTRIVQLIARCARRYVLSIPPKIGSDMVGETGSKPATSEASVRQKQVVLDALDVTTSVKEAYLKIRVYLEEATAAHRWDFDASDEEVLFAEVDYIYERCLELLVCIDATARHYAKQRELKKLQHQQGFLHCNPAFLSASLNDVCCELNDMEFDFTSPANSKEWQELFARVRQKSEALTQLESGEPPEGKDTAQSTGCTAEEPPAEGGDAPAVCAQRAFVAKPPSETLLVILSFNPPEVLISGPIGEATVDRLTYVLPQAFTTATSKVLFGKVTPPCFVQRQVGEEGWGELGKKAHDGPRQTYWHLRAEAHFCDNLAQAYICVTILDALEQGRWVLRDTNASYLPLSSEKADGSKVYYKYFFTRKPLPEAEAGGGGVEEEDQQQQQQQQQQADPQPPAAESSAAQADGGGEVVAGLQGEATAAAAAATMPAVDGEELCASGGS